MYRILALSGSLRQGSFNTGLLRAAMELAPPTLSIERADLGDVPLYNEDVRQRGLPPAVAELRRRRRRPAHRHPRVQLLDLGRPQERHRLGLAPA